MMEKRTELFVEQQIKKAKENGINVILSNLKTIGYVGDETCQVNGYFVDRPTKELAVACGQEESRWLSLFAHESSHMDQFLENSEVWNNIFINGRESLDYVMDWVKGEEIEKELISDYIERAFQVELDCEKRTLEKIKNFNLDIDQKEYVKKANSYITFYYIMEKIRKWYIVGKEPYNLVEVWSEMPDNFSCDYKKLAEDKFEIYIKYCF